MLTYKEFKAKALQDPAVRAEYERIEREEGPMLDAILAARREAVGCRLELRMVPQ